MDILLIALLSRADPASPVTLIQKEPKYMLNFKLLCSDIDFIPLLTCLKLGICLNILLNNGLKSEAQSGVETAPEHR